MHLSPGAHVRSFEVLGPLGAGGMGAVYRARDNKLGRELAIKFLADDLSQNHEYLRRFEREARAASALNHPNIITIFEVSEYDGAPFIAMELVSGISLRELLKSGALPLRKLLNIATQVADGLAAAHERGIVHRDLKPENVMVTNDGRVKIVDFGLARVNRPSSPSESTSELSAIRTPEGRVMGTAAYVSPEQAAGGSRRVDYRSDQFSFGALLYELASGRRAFERNSTVETLAAIMRDEPEPLERINPKIPSQLVWLIERCLAKDPSERYADTRDLARDLRTLRDRLPDTSPGRVVLPTWTHTRAAVIVAVVVVAVIALIGSWRRFSPPLAPLPNQKYLAVLPFKDLSGRPDGQLFSQGLGEAVSARLAKYSGIQVISPAASVSLVAKSATFQRIAQEVGATLLLSGSVQRSGERLRVTYSIVNPAGVSLFGDEIDGSLDNIWAVQDETADHIAKDLGVEQRRAPTNHIGLETPQEQNLYLRALGNLDHLDDQNTIETAIDQFRDLEVTASDSALVHAGLARAYLAKYTITREKESSDLAIAEAKKAATLDPQSADVLLTLADVERNVGKFADAIATYKRTLATKPNLPEAAVGLARAQHAALQFSEAEASFRRGIALRPTWWSGYYYLGALYLTRARYADAARQFTQVTQLDPQNAWGYIGLGIVSVSQGDLQAGVRAYSKVLTLKEDADAYSNLGYCYYFLGEPEKAAASYKKAAELRPNVGTYWANLADTCRWTTTCRDNVRPYYSRAITLLNADLDVNPNRSSTRATLAVCLARTGQTAEAKRQIDAALKLDPANPTRMFQAARVANAYGDTTAAVGWLKRAVAAGYQRFEIERDPELMQLRQTRAFRDAFADAGPST